MAAQLIHVVRHAHAGDRDAWRFDDDLRPLSDRGCAQAQRLAAAFDGIPAAVYSSPSLRCLATVLPLARHAGVAVSTRSDLYEGQGAAAMLEALLDEPRFPVVACTHGDVLVDLLTLLVDAGVHLPSNRVEKGSTWTLSVRDGSVSAAQYAPQP